MRKMVAADGCLPFFSPLATPFTDIGTMDGGNSTRVHSLTPLAVPLSLKARYRGVRIIVGDDQSLQLAIRPHTLDADTRERLLHLTYQQQGPDPGIALIAFHAGRRDHAALFGLLQGAPNLLAAAAAAGYLTYDTDDDGRLVAIQLTPEVTFSLDIATDLHDSFLLDP